MKEEEMDIADYPLEPIIDYQMDPMQAKAYKLLIMWLVYSRRIFPDYKWGSNRMPKGDPRKSHAWKCCYKAVRDLDGKLKDDELGLYVKAQLQIMKAITDGEAHPLIDTHCLCAKNSWARWCVWKKHYDQKVVERNSRKAEAEMPKADTSGVQKELEKAKAFLIHIFRREPTYDDIKDAVDSRSLVRWTKLKKITPYYAVLSKWVGRALGDTSVTAYMTGFDMTPYPVTPDLQECFRRVFQQED